MEPIIRVPLSASPTASRTPRNRALIEALSFLLGGPHELSGPHVEVIHRVPGSRSSDGEVHRGLDAASSGGCLCMCLSVAPPAMPVLVSLRPRNPQKGPRDGDHGQASANSTRRCCVQLPVRDPHAGPAVRPGTPASRRGMSDGLVGKSIRSPGSPGSNTASWPRRGASSMIGQCDLGSPSSAAQVFGPTIPSTLSPHLFWKPRVARSVSAPKIPSMGPGAIPWILSRF
jgi:hypothetical protein